MTYVYVIITALALAGTIWWQFFASCETVRETAITVGQIPYRCAGEIL